MLNLHSKYGQYKMCKMSQQVQPVGTSSAYMRKGGGLVGVQSVSLRPAEVDLLAVAVVNQFR